MSKPQEGVRTIAGTVPIGPLGFVLRDTPATSNDPARTPGQARAVQLNITPGVMQRFTLLGFSVSLRLGAMLGTLASRQYWARFGDLWAGIYTSSPLPPSSDALQGSFSYTTGPAFPPDLSTFAKLWTGATDDVTVFTSNVTPPFADRSTLIAQNVMFPVPVPVNPSTLLGFGLVMTPSIVSVSLGNGAGLTIWSCTYSVIYSVENVDYGQS